MMFLMKIYQIIRSINSSITGSVSKDNWFLIYFWCINATFSNISAISWRPVLLVEEAGVRREPPTMDRQLVNLFTCGCESSAPFSQKNNWSFPKEQVSASERPYIIFLTDIFSWTLFEVYINNRSNLKIYSGLWQTKVLRQIIIRLITLVTNIMHNQN